MTVTSATASELTNDDGLSWRAVGATVLPALGVLAVQLVLFPLPAGAWLQGLVLGLLNALVVLGLMLVYRANRVLNFAQASMGTFPAALAVGLILFSSVPYLLALGIGIMAAVVIGIGTDLLIIRRFRRSPRLILTVATIGLAQMYAVGALVVPRFWDKEVLVTSNGSGGYEAPFDLHVTIGQQVFRSDDLMAAVVSIICLVAVSLFLRGTDVGTAIRAAADRGDRASMLGVPVLRLETAVWAIASVLSFLGVFLQGAILGFPITAALGLSTLVTALAAMALGGFESMPASLTAAVAIGVLNKGVAWHNDSRPEAVYAVLAVVVLVALLVLRTGKRRGGESVSSWQISMEPRSVPAELRNLTELRIARWVGGIALLVLGALLPLVLSPSQEFRAATICAYGILAISVVVLTGWAGEVTLGQMGFAAVGGSLCALASIEWQWDLTLVLLFAGAAGAIAAVVVGIPSLRLHGIFLAVTTLAFSLAASGWLFNPAQFSWIPTDALIRRKLLGVWSLESQAAMYEVCLGVLVLALVALAGIRRSRAGRLLRAVRDNERGAQAYGVRAKLVRVMAFAVSGCLASIAGALLIYVSQGFDAGTFAPEQSLNTFISAVIGGVGSTLGGLLGAVVYDGGRNWLSGPWALLPSAIGVLVVLLVLPGGLADLVYRVRDAVLRRIAGRRGIVVPSLVADVRTEPDGGAELGTATPDGDQPVVEITAPEGDGWLSVSGLDVAYGAAQVLFGVDVDIPKGQITALLGTNGAGKSTLLRAVGGVAPVTGGQIQLGGVDLVKRRPDQIAGLGIAQMPGGQGVFPSLTVDENLRVAAWLIRKDRDQVRTRAEEVYERFPVLSSRRNDEAGNLSGGQQQQLALGMALLTRPQLLLVDELSLGLAPAIVDQLMDELRQLCDEGTTIVVVEQSVNLALTIANHAYFMEKGEVRFSGPAQHLLDQPDLVRSVYLKGAAAGLAGDGGRAVSTPSAAGAPGRSADHPTTERPSTDRAALEVHGLSVSFGGITAVNDVDLTVAPGEIVGLIGPNGAGKTTIFDLVSGFTSADAGRVILHGHDITRTSPAERARAGLGRSFQDARLFAGLTVEETIAVALERWIQAGDPLSAALRLPANEVTEAAVAERVDELIDLFGIGAFRSKPISELSTGSRRMVDLACSVAQGPTVVLLDEPSSGIAQREAEALVPLLLQLRDRLGASLLVVEHDMALVATAADRLVALDEGAVLTEGQPDDVLEHPEVVASYLGSNSVARQRSGPHRPDPASDAPATQGAQHR